jgi:hypothetical protein
MTLRLSRSAFGLALLVVSVAMMGSDQHASNGLRQMLQSASIFHFHTPTACQRKYFSFIAKRQVGVTLSKSGGEGQQLRGQKQRDNDG